MAMAKAMAMVGVEGAMIQATMIAKVKARAQSKAIAEKGGAAEVVEKGATGVIGLAVRARARARAEATANPRRKVHQHRRSPVSLAERVRARAEATVNPRRKVHRNQGNPVKGLAVWLRQIQTTRRLGIFNDTSRVPRVRVTRPNLPILGRARVDRLLERARVDPILVKGAGRDIHPPVPRQRR